MTITALNIGSSAIKYLVLKGNGATKQGSVPPAGPIKNGSILQPDIIAGQLKSLFASKRLPRNGGICSVNGLPFSYRLFTLPKMEPEAFNEALLRMTRKEMPVALEEMYLSWQAYPAENDEWQILVTGITRQPVDNLMGVLAKAGIKPSFLDMQQLALARLANQKNAIIVDFEKDYSNIVILVEGVPVGMQVVPSFGPGAALQDEVKQIADRISQMVEFYNGSHPRKPVQEATKILLTGGLLNDDKALKLIQEETMYPVELLNPENNVFSGSSLHEYAANAGSTLVQAAQGRDADGNLAPYHNIDLGNIAEERRASRKSGNILIKLLVPLAIVVGIGALVPSYLSQSELQASVTQLQADLAQANAQYNRVLESVNGAKAIEDSISEIEANAGKIKSGSQAIISSKNYVNDISFIIKAMPEGVSYTSLEIDAGQITILGDASTAPPVVQFARNMESSGGYSAANINWINPPRSEKGNAGVSFMIVISR
jgi:Tfp pilus assembly PilM family ATPase/Tfp pilus assembly protein PilN